MKRDKALMKKRNTTTKVKLLPPLKDFPNRRIQQITSKNWRKRSNK